MNGDRRRRGTFMIADLLGDVLPTSPPEANKSDGATGNDVIVDDVIDYPDQSAATITENNCNFEHSTYNRLITEDPRHNVDGTLMPADRFALFRTAEAFPRSRPLVVEQALSPGGLIHRPSPSSSCFREAGILPGGLDDEGLHEMMAVPCQPLNQHPRRCITPLHWHAVVCQALHAAGQTPNVSLIWRQA